jgi:hypothetical protein
MVLEANPKWQLLLQVMTEIDQAQAQDKQQQQQQQQQQQTEEDETGAGQQKRHRPWLGTSTEPAPPVLVIGADERTCSQLSEVLNQVDAGGSASAGASGQHGTNGNGSTERYLQTQFR